MTELSSAVWISTFRQSVASYRRMIDSITVQLSDQELFVRPAPEINSVAILLRHLGGNLKSRWSDFLTTDGEKPDRNRDAEFADWDGDRASLFEYFNEGWKTLEAALDSLSDEDAGRTVMIRGESHSVAQALTRSITHLSYHVGQMAMVARMVHEGDWNWLTIAPGHSQTHNEKTWGTAESRSVFNPPTT